MSATSGVAAVPRPRAVTAITVLVIVAAAVNAVFGLLTLTQIEPARRLLVQNARRQGTDPASLEAVLVGTFAVIVLASLLYAAALVVFVLVFRRGRPWGRVALFATSLLSLYALFAPNGPALAVVLLLAVADVLLYRAPVSAWVRSLRGLRAA